MGYKNNCKSLRGRKYLIRVATVILGVLLFTSYFAILENDVFGASSSSSKRQNSINLGEKEISKIQVNKYSNYIHLQPEWDSYPRNMIFEITNIWNKTNTEQSLNERDFQRGAKTNVNTLQHIEGKSYLEVQYDYIDCNYQWIHYARSSLDILGSKLDYYTGRQLDSDHNSALFSHIHGSKDIELDSNASYYSQFIPICTSKEKTSVDYGVRIDDKTIGFDVYFVSSENERFNFHRNFEDFSYYPTCFGLNYQSFSGTCNDVDKKSGLLIIIPDSLNKPLTKISVKINEK